MKKSSKLKIVTIGGGSGQSLLLKYLKNYNLDISAIVSMVDDGGSTGVLRKELDVLPPGDVRKCLLALSTKNQKLQKAMETRFDGGHSFGNLMISGLELELDNFNKHDYELEENSSEEIYEAVKNMLNWEHVNTSKYKSLLPIVDGGFGLLCSSYYEKFVK